MAPRVGFAGTSRYTPEAVEAEHAKLVQLAAEPARLEVFKHELERHVLLGAHLAVFKALELEGQVGEESVFLAHLHGLPRAHIVVHDEAERERDRADGTRELQYPEAGCADTEIVGFLRQHEEAVLGKVLLVVLKLLVLDADDVHVLGALHCYAQIEQSRVGAPA
eukprot:6186329-Pleurochrysis_carterae.AAC.4